MILTFLHLRDADRMVAYTVHEPPHSGGDRLDRAETLVFVKDGFNFMAALLTPIWMLVNRMWLAFGVYLAGMIGLGLLMSALGASDAWVALVQVAINILIGFEADSLKRWTLERKGWTSAGTVTGRNSTECERRFFEDWLPRQEVLRVGGEASLSGGFHAASPERASASRPVSRVGWFSRTSQADA
ncbi:MAG: DUF2628 domain-containing protein [Pseudomonadota bacterium]